jgi:adenylate cyclase
VVALALALFASARLARPVQALVTYAGDLANRRWDRRIALHTGDELEELAVAMSGAAAQLQESEERIARERRLRGELGRYLPAQLVDKLAKGDQDLALGGEQRTITVLFADVASFTSLVERKSPEEVATILNQLFTILTEVVFHHGGTVDKFIGDCVMAFWGAPAPAADHAARAVAAAEAMLRWLELGNEAWQAQHGVTLHLSIGVHSGPAVVGNFGSESRMEYTAVGDTVNIAARLEALARPQQILVSSATRDAAPAADCVAAGTYSVPGRREPLELHEVMWR